MNPVEFDGIRIVVLDRPIHDSDVQAICAGTGTYDGEVFTVASDDGDTTRLNDEILQATEMPLTGHWKRKYPDYDWYLVGPEKRKAEQDVVGNGGQRS
ncbi:MAG: hypothetical protein AAF591_20735 [Verrucomicrobiota bacterium]